MNVQVAPGGEAGISTRTSKVKEAIDKAKAKPWAGTAASSCGPSGTEPLLRVMVEGEDLEHYRKCLPRTPWRMSCGSVWRNTV